MEPKQIVTVKYSGKGGGGDGLFLRAPLLDLQLPMCAYCNENILNLFKFKTSNVAVSTLPCSMEVNYLHGSNDNNFYSFLLKPSSCNFENSEEFRHSLFLPFPLDVYCRYVAVAP